MNITTKESIMDITLNQSEIETAIRQYVGGQGISLTEKLLSMTFTSGRKENGLSASLVITDKPIIINAAPVPVVAAVAVVTTAVDTTIGIPGFDLPVKVDFEAPALEAATTTVTATVAEALQANGANMAPVEEVASANQDNSLFGTAETKAVVFNTKGEITDTDNEPAAEPVEEVKEAPVVKPITSLFAQ